MNAFVEMGNKPKHSLLTCKIRMSDKSYLSYFVSFSVMEEKEA